MKIKLYFVLCCSLLLVLSCMEPLMAAPVENGRVEGRVVNANGSPVTNVGVLFFSNDIGPLQMPQKYDWLPDVGVPVNQDGLFSVTILPGKYWYGVMRMPERGGRLSEWLYVSNEKDGSVKRVEIKKGLTCKIGDIKIPANMFAGRQEDPVAIINGHILDQFRKPVAGMVVEAYANTKNDARPVFSSNLTDENGMYSIRMTAGVFFLKIRPLSRFSRNGKFNKNYSKYILSNKYYRVVAEGDKVISASLIARLKE